MRKQHQLVVCVCVCVCVLVYWKPCLGEMTNSMLLWIVWQNPGGRKPSPWQKDGVAGYEESSSCKKEKWVMIRIECQTSFILLMWKGECDQIPGEYSPFPKEDKRLSGRRKLLLKLLPGLLSPRSFPFVLISMFKIFSLWLAVISIKMPFTWKHLSQEKQNIYHEKTQHVCHSSDLRPEQ